MMLKRQNHKLDLWLIIVTFMLLIIGLLTIYDATVVSAFRDFSDKLYYFKNQLVWTGISLIALTFFSFMNYHILLKFSPILLVISLVLLTIVIIPQIGTEVYGARRWINFGSLTFQPSEIAKLAVILYLTGIIAKFENYQFRLNDIFIVFFLPVLAVITLVILEPDLGTALLFAALAIVIYFIGKAPVWHFIIAVPMLIGATVIAIITEPYRLVRLKSFLDPTYDPQGASYQINQILVALSSGGLFGQGIGASRSKFTFIPEVQSDAIFAVFVEELGFIGAIFLILLFLFLISRAISIARNASDISGKILASSIAGLIGIQTLFNLASNVALVPLTGIPLPFISYGGSSLFVTLVSVGILINIGRNS